MAQPSVEEALRQEGRGHQKKAVVRAQGSVSGKIVDSTDMLMISMANPKQIITGSTNRMTTARQHGPQYRASKQQQRTRTASQTRSRGWRGLVRTVHGDAHPAANGDDELGHPRRVRGLHSKSDTSPYRRQLDHRDREANDDAVVREVAVVVVYRLLRQRGVTHVESPSSRVSPSPLSR